MELSGASIRGGYGRAEGSQALRCACRGRRPNRSALPAARPGPGGPAAALGSDPPWGAAACARSSSCASWVSCLGYRPVRRRFEPESIPLWSRRSDARARSNVPSGRGFSGPVAAAGGQAPLHLAAVLPLGDGLALLIFPLASSQPQLHLRQAPREVDLQGNQGEAALGGLADQPADLLAFEEELSRPHRDLAADVGHLVRGDVQVIKTILIADHAGVGVAKVCAAGPDGLHLGACQ